MVLEDCNDGEYLRNKEDDECVSFATGNPVRRRTRYIRRRKLVVE